jgi:xanthine dehydrogenase accessory factor
MLFPDHLVLIRGGGDLATGAAWRLTRAGFPVVVCELPRPLAIRRTVAVSSAVEAGEVEIEGMTAVLVDSPAEAVRRAGDPDVDVAVLVEPGLPPIAAWAVVDARMAKRNLGTTRDDADLVVALGPGFTAGDDCHAVVETMRSHHLGRVIWAGPAIADTGAPGELGGRTTERLVRAPRSGTVHWRCEIGDHVAAGEIIGDVAGTELSAPLTGVVRGLIAPGTDAAAGLKIADIDPRGDRRAAFEISDKALAVGGGVLEAVLTWLHR